MIKTFTPDLEIAAITTETEAESKAIGQSEPALQTIRNILNYSKNLEIRQSDHLGEVSFVRS